MACSCDFPGCRMPVAFGVTRFGRKWHFCSKNHEEQVLLASQQRAAPQDQPPPKFCVDCKWHKESESGYLKIKIHLCQRPGLPVSPVTGNQKVRPCHNEREDLFLEQLQVVTATGVVRDAPHCGPEGKFWEPKEPNICDVCGRPSAQTVTAANGVTRRRCHMHFEYVNPT